MTYFYQNSNIYWGPGQPDNSAGSQGCAYWWANGNKKLDDLACSGRMSAACCMRFPPSPSPTVSVSATATLSLGASASVTPAESGTPTSSASATPSIYVEQIAPVAADTTGEVIGGLVAAVVVCALGGGVLFVLVPAYALWRRQQQRRRGGAIKSSARIINQRKRDASSFRVVDSELGDINPVQAAALIQLSPTIIRASSAPRLVDTQPSASKRPSARQMGLGI